jgi:hypothetical protein
MFLLSSQCLFAVRRSPFYAFFVAVRRSTFSSPFAVRRWPPGSAAPGFCRGARRAPRPPDSAIAGIDLNPSPSPNLVSKSNFKP